MKHITSSPADSPYKLVNYGIDTLVLNVRYADATGKPVKGDDALLPDYLIACLSACQNIAREKDAPVPMSDFSYEHADLMMYPHGAGKGQWRWLIHCPSFALAISRGRLNGVIAQVRFSAQYLWSHEWPENHRQDIWKPIKDVQDFLTDLFAPESRRLHLQPSELHLCADVTGWDVSACDWEHAFLSRARTRINQADESTAAAGGARQAIIRNRSLATLNFGTHASPLSCCIYNKTQELKVSRKSWFEYRWRPHGWDGISPVWRIEYRWKREALHEAKQEGVFHGIEDIRDLDSELLSSLWAYAAGHTQCGDDGLPDGWLRYAAPSDDTNMARWPVHPAWQVIQSAFSTETEPAVNTQTGEVFELPASSLATLIRERHYEENIKRLAVQVGGCASTLAAWLHGSADTLPAVLDYLVDHLPAYTLSDLAQVVPVDLLEEEYARRFEEKVEEKRSLYGVSDNNENEVQHD
jgi:hypothetical protein